MKQGTVPSSILCIFCKCSSCLLPGKVPTSNVSLKYNFTKSQGPTDLLLAGQGLCYFLPDPDRTLVTFRYTSLFELVISIVIELTLCNET